MITTDKIQLTSKDFFKIILTISFRKKWWGFVFFGILAMVLVFQEDRYSLKEFLIIFAILFPVVFVIKHWIYSYSKDNRIFLLERHFEIYEDKIVEILNDGTNSLIKNDHFIKVIRTKKFYLLYFAKEQFIFIAKDSFKSEKDKEWFEREILRKYN